MRLTTEQRILYTYWIPIVDIFGWKKQIRLNNSTKFYKIGNGDYHEWVIWHWMTQVECNRGMCKINNQWTFFEQLRINHWNPWFSLTNVYRTGESAYKLREYLENYFIISLLVENWEIDLSCSSSSWWKKKSFTYLYLNGFMILW